MSMRTFAGEQVEGLDQITEFQASHPGRDIVQCVLEEKSFDAQDRRIDSVRVKDLHSPAICLLQLHSDLRIPSIALTNSDSLLYIVSENNHVPGYDGCIQALANLTTKRNYSIL